jgi:hypothetical protein
MFIIEQKYGNDGYAFWFKLLEMMGKEDGHFIDFRDESKWAFFQAKTKLSEETCQEIFDLLAKLGAIDPSFWKIRVVWSQNFVDGIASVYGNRRVDAPTAPSYLHVVIPPIEDNYSKKTVKETIVKDSRVKESKEAKKTPTPSFVLPEWLPKDIFDEFVAFRAQIKKPLAEASYKRFCASLKNLCDSTKAEPEDILSQSIANGWQGIFPLKDNFVKKPLTNNKNNGNDPFTDCPNCKKRVLKTDLINGKCYTCDPGDKNAGISRLFQQKGTAAQP